MRAGPVAIACVLACGRLDFDTESTRGDGRIDAFASRVPSCEGRAPTCGASGASDCCASLPVPGGSFYRGYDVAADGMHATMAYPATISSFHLDAYEVTVARFRQFVAAGMGTQATAPANDAGAHPNLTASGWQSAWNIGLQPDSTSLVAAVDDDCMQGSGAAMVKTWTDAPASNEDRPIVCVDWYEAFAFCIWDGGYLPTVAESMYAASGGTDQRAYPWSQPFGSTAIDPSDASYSDGTDCVGDGLPGCSVTDLVDVGTKPAGDGAWDQSDLAGNASEMVLDWWMGADAFPDPCTDCAQLTDPGAGARITYGGAYDSNVDQQRSAWADFNVGPSARWHNVGFRCARQ